MFYDYMFDLTEKIMHEGITFELVQSINDKLQKYRTFVEYITKWYLTWSMHCMCSELSRIGTKYKSRCEKFACLVLVSQSFSDYYAPDCVFEFGHTTGLELLAASANGAK